ncbi:MAG: ATP-binding protein [Candidatus Poribacteria bacterium]|nr:ATP-binding protein [Candidatus Poribacteria bacterium]
MKIKSIHLKDFKRFTDLTIEGLPETAKLVVMIGPNGCGKSSVFDALKLKDCFPNAVGPEMISDNYYQILEYYFKSNENRYHNSYYGSLNQTPNERIRHHEIITHSAPLYHFAGDLDVKFHGTEPPDEWNKSVHVRSAYRNYSVTQPYTARRDDLLEKHRLVRLIENDEVLVLNCWRLASQLLERSSEIGQSVQDLNDFQGEILCELRDTIGRLFTDPPLVLKNLGHPADGDLFQFDKGTSERFSFQNLASGEKAALDLLLDVIITKVEYDETIICIDEPEAHIHTKLQGQLLEELYNLVSEKSQLWIATHSVGMVCKAQDLWREDPDSVVFLDFGNHNFDEAVTIIPTEPNPNFWAQIYDIALGDLAKLVGPQRIVLCEGKIEDADKAFDAVCYNQIFGVRYPETLFISIGAASDIKVADKKRIPLIKAIAGGIQTIRIRDKDILTPEQIKEGLQEGIHTLNRREIENYLLADEVLIKLCQDKAKSNKTHELLAAKHNLKKKVLKSDKGEDKPDDKLKCIAADFYERAKDILGLQIEYTSKEPERDFMKYELAPLIKPNMDIYKELHKVIFGEGLIN